MKQIIYLITSVLFIAGCASQSVRLTDDETQQLMEQNPTLVNLLKSRGRAEGRYKHRYYFCNSKQQQAAGGGCYEVECHGLEDPIKCFKTPMDAEAQQAYTEKMNARFLTDNEVDTHRATCLNAPTKFSLKEKNSQLKYQESCFLFLTSDYKKPANYAAAQYVIDFERSADIFCKMVNSYCRKNGSPTSSGGYNQFADNSRVRSVKLRQGSNTNHYEFAFSQ